MRKRIISRITALALCYLLVLPYVASQSDVIADGSVTITEGNVIMPCSDEPPAKDGIY